MAFIGTFQFRRDVAAAWTAANPVLLAGELAIETDTDQFKLGDGTTPWNALPYGGLQGAQGVQGVQGQQGVAGNNGWSPVLSVEVDGERRVLRVVDWVGGTGTKPATGSYIGSTGFVATPAQATDIRGPQGAAGVNATATNSFANVSIGTTPVATVLSADNAADTLTLTAGTGITLTADAVNDSFSIVNADTGSAARTAHEAAADPHPQYGLRTLSAGRATEFLSTANNNTVQSVLTLVVPAASIVAGLTFEFEMWGTQTNIATTGGNNSVILRVNGTAVATATVAVGTTAQTNRAWLSQGALVFRSATQVVASIQHLISGLAAVVNSNAAAPTTIAAGNVTLELAVQTATANAGNTIRVGIATIKED